MMAGEGEGTGNGGGAGGEGEKAPIPYHRFQEVVSERNTMRDRIKTLEKEAQGALEKAATADTLASQLKELQAERKKEQGAWEEERGLLRAGFTDPDAIDVARVLHGKLPEKDRPSLGDWLEGHRKAPDKAPKALTPWLAAQEGNAGGKGNAGGSGGSSSGGSGGKGNADTRGGQRADGQQRAGEPLTADKIKEIRERAQASGDWSEWKKVRDQAYSAE
jgi:hypothetical protein